MPLVRLRLVTVGLVLGAVGADAAGQHSLAYYALVAAVPAAAVAALTALGAILDGSAAEPADRVLAALSALVLPFLLLASAVRAPLVEGAPPPAAGVTAVACCFGVFALQGIVAAVSALAPAPRRVAGPAEVERAAVSRRAA